MESAKWDTGEEKRAGEGAVAGLAARLSGHLRRAGSQWDATGERWLGVCMVGLRADCAQGSGSGEFEYEGSAWYFCAPIKDPSQEPRGAGAARICVEGLKSLAVEKSDDEVVKAVSMMVAVREGAGKAWRVSGVVTTVCPKGHEAMAEALAAEGFSLPPVKAQAQEEVGSAYDFCGECFEEALRRCRSGWEVRGLAEATGNGGWREGEARRI